MMKLRFYIKVLGLMPDVSVLCVCVREYACVCVCLCV